MSDLDEVAQPKAAAKPEARTGHFMLTGRRVGTSTQQPCRWPPVCSSISHSSLTSNQARRVWGLLDLAQEAVSRIPQYSRMGYRLRQTDRQRGFAMPAIFPMIQVMRNAISQRIKCVFEAGAGRCGSVCSQLASWAELPQAPCPKSASRGRSCG